VTDVIFHSWIALDTNGNGDVEIGSEISPAAAKLDKNHDGKLDVRELDDAFVAAALSQPDGIDPAKSPRQQAAATIEDAAGTIEAIQSANLAGADRAGIIPAWLGYGLGGGTMLIGFFAGAFIAPMLFLVLLIGALLLGVGLITSKIATCVKLHELHERSLPAVHEEEQNLRDAWRKLCEAAPANTPANALAPPAGACVRTR
jgi:hypothetical protein